MASSRRGEGYQRAAKACIPCKAAKKRCTGGTPCAYCVNHRRAASCRYTDDGTDSRVQGGGTGTSSMSSRKSPPSNHSFPILDQMPAAVSSMTYAEVDAAVGDATSDSTNTQSPNSTMSFIPARLLRKPKGNEGTPFFDRSAFVSLVQEGQLNCL